jgi:hypothetical protein
LSAFRIQDWKVWTLTEGVDTLVCGMLPYPLPNSDRSAVFPIWYAGDGWEDTTFYSSQPVDTVFFFFFAVGLYALVLAANTVITTLLFIDYKVLIVLLTSIRARAEALVHSLTDECTRLCGLSLSLSRSRRKWRGLGSR